MYRACKVMGKQLQDILFPPFSVLDFVGAFLITGATWCHVNQSVFIAVQENLIKEYAVQSILAVLNISS